MAADPELEQVFQEELAEHLESLERQRVILASASDVTDEVREAAREIHRIAHSAKGAARLAGYAELERACHALENDLSDARHGQVADLQRIIGTARYLAAQLNSAVPDSVPPTSLPNASASQANEARLAGDPRLTELVEMAEQLLLFGHKGAVEEDLKTVQEAVSVVVRRLTRSEPRGALQALEVALWSLQETLSAQQAELTRRSKTLLSHARGLQLVTLDSLATTLTRSALEAAQALNKDVDVSIELSGIRVDRRLRDGLRESLMHLATNAIDHGIESAAERIALGKTPRGSLVMRAYTKGAELRLEVSDDGRGLDDATIYARAVELGFAPKKGDDPKQHLFQPGFSLKSEAGRHSGRGMGLDIVRQRVLAQHGRVSVENREGGGARFSLAMPIDLSAMRAVCMRSAGTLLAIATAAVDRVGSATDAELLQIDGSWFVSLGDSGAVPLVRAATLLGLQEAASAMQPERRFYVVLSARAGGIALEVDQVLDEREVVTRSFPERIARVPFVTGLTVLDGGELALLLDPGEVLRASQPASVQARRSKITLPRVLIADDSLTTRQLLKSMLEVAGYQVEVAANGEAAWELLTQVGPFALVVSDVDMPKMDGYELLSKIRTTVGLGRLPVVLVTALDSDSERTRARELGASAFLGKGEFDQARLLELIEELT